MIFKSRERKEANFGYVYDTVNDMFNLTISVLLPNTKVSIRIV